MDLIICSVVHAKRAGECSKSVAGSGRRAASLLSTDIMVVVYSAAEVQFGPVLRPFSPNLELQKSSVRRDHPNPGPNLSERVRRVQFWFRTGSNHEPKPTLV
jgi:hypothetical protein